MVLGPDAKPRANTHIDFMAMDFSINSQEVLQLKSGMRVCESLRVFFGKEKYQRALSLSLFSFSHVLNPLPQLGQQIEFQVFVQCHLISMLC